MESIPNLHGGLAGWTGAESHRAENRYELSLDLVAHPIDASSVWQESAGRTIHLSSTAALIELDCVLKPGERVECCINWPMPADRPAKNLVVEAIVVGANGNRASITFIRRYFISEADRERRMRRRAAYRTA